MSLVFSLKGKEIEVDTRRHVLKLRTAKSAHPQMRELMTMVEAELVAEAPSVFVR